MPLKTINNFDQFFSCPYSTSFTLALQALSNGCTASSISRASPTSSEAEFPSFGGYQSNWSTTYQRALYYRLFEQHMLPFCHERRCPRAHAKLSLGLPEPCNRRMNLIDKYYGEV